MIVAFTLVAVLVAPKHSYQYVASFIEGCSCKDICVTEITGRDAGCHGVGGIQFKSGKFDGKDISGTAAAFAWDSGKWVDLTVDASDSKLEAVTSLMKSFLADWGKLETVRRGQVLLASSEQVTSLVVNKGHSSTLVVKPVYGAKGKYPVVHSNLASPIHSTLMQGVTTSCEYLDVHQFTLKNTNGFYNSHFAMKGKIP